MNLESWLSRSDPPAAPSSAMVNVSNYCYCSDEEVTRVTLHLHRHSVDDLFGPRIESDFSGVRVSISDDGAMLVLVL